MLELLTAPVSTALARRLSIASEVISGLYSLPTKGVVADVALPCFQLAKSAGKAPAVLAQELAPVVCASCPGVSASASGPFLNLIFSNVHVATVVLPALSDPIQALRSQRGAGRTICIDFSSPNIAKHLAFHHIRSTMIGNALANLYAAVGWKVVRINFIGDWGTAFGRLIAGWKRENLQLEHLTSADNQVQFLNELYVRISRQGDADPQVALEARAWSKKLEEGDSEALSLWETIRAASLAAAQQVYALLGVSFDDWRGEAHYRNAMGPIIEELREKQLLKLDQGAQVVELTSLGMKKPCIIQRSDGGSLYSTRDLAACDDRFQRYHFQRSLIVVNLGQSLHFKEWFGVARLLGRSYADGLAHIGFGVVLMWNEEEQAWAKTATRKGVPMILMEVLEEAINRAREIIIEKNPEIVGAERDAISQAVGVGAVVFNDLKHSRTTDVKFTFSEALRFDGETGPYLQFSHARLCSIERKYAENAPSGALPEPRLLSADLEKAVLLAISRMRPALERAVEHDEPSVLALNVLHLASTIATWLTSGNHDLTLRVLCPDAQLSASRLALARAARGVLGEGLRLLGLQAPSRM